MLIQNVKKKKAKCICSAISKATQLSPGHVLAGLSPGEAGDRARVGQVDEGEGQLSLGRARLGGGEEAGDPRLPLDGAVPHLHQAVVLHTERPRERHLSQQTSNANTECVFVLFIA